MMKKGIDESSLAGRSAGAILEQTLWTLRRFWGIGRAGTNGRGVRLSGMWQRDPAHGTLPRQAGALRLLFDVCRGSVHPSRIAVEAKAEVRLEGFLGHDGKGRQGFRVLKPRSMPDPPAPPDILRGPDVDNLCEVSVFIEGEEKDGLERLSLRGFGFDRGEEEWQGRGQSWSERGNEVGQRNTICMRRGWASV